MPSKLSPDELRRLNSMEFFIAEIKKYKIKPKIIFDIGSYNAAHLKELCDVFSVPIKCGYAFEAHPGMVKHCKNRGVNVLHCAIANFDGGAYFNAIDLTADCHHGCSSLYHIGRPHNRIQVTVRRIDTLIDEGVDGCVETNINSVKIPDTVKIDVEGKSFEVLQGFGKYLRHVKILHVECETKECYCGQKTEKDILAFMDNAGFSSVHQLFIPEFQIDHIFVRKDLVF